MSDSIQRIIDGNHNDADLETLRQLLDSDSLKTTLQLGEDNINIDRQVLVQIGKYNINIGKGENIQIGDIYYPELNSESIQTILEHLFQKIQLTNLTHTPKLDSVDDLANYLGNIQDSTNKFDGITKKIDAELQIPIFPHFLIDDSAFTRKAIDVSAVISTVIIDLIVNFNMVLPFSLPIEIRGKNSNFLEQWLIRIALSEYRRNNLVFLTIYDEDPEQFFKTRKRLEGYSEVSNFYKDEEVTSYVNIFVPTKKSKSTTDEILVLANDSHYNTNSLVDDIYLLLKQENVKNVNLIASSWGCTLAVLFAIKYPEDLKFLVLRSTFLSSQSEVDYLYTKLAEDNRELWNRCFPNDYGKKLSVFFAEQYDTFLTNLNTDTTVVYSKWIEWEKNLGNNSTSLIQDSISIQDKIYCLVQAHYYTNSFFLGYYGVTEMLAHVQSPMIIISSQSDLVTPSSRVKKMLSNLDNVFFMDIECANHAVSHNELDHWLSRTMQIINR